MLEEIFMRLCQAPFSFDGDELVDAAERGESGGDHVGADAPGVDLGALALEVDDEFLVEIV